MAMTLNMSAHTGVQHRDATSRQLLCAGGLAR